MQAEQMVGSKRVHGKSKMRLWQSNIISEQWLNAFININYEASLRILRNRGMGKNACHACASVQAVHAWRPGNWVCLPCFLTERESIFKVLSLHIAAFVRQLSSVSSMRLLSKFLTSLSTLVHASHNVLVDATFSTYGPVVTSLGPPW